MIKSLHWHLVVCQRNSKCTALDNYLNPLHYHSSLSLALTPKSLIVGDRLISSRNQQSLLHHCTVIPAQSPPGDTPTAIRKAPTFGRGTGAEKRCSSKVDRFEPQSTCSTCMRLGSKCSLVMDSRALRQSLPYRRDLATYRTAHPAQVCRRTLESHQ